MSVNDYKLRADFYYISNGDYATSKWVSLRTLTPNQIMLAKSQDMTITHEVKCRYTKDITRDMYIVINDTRFEIETLYDRDMRHEELIMSCLEVA